MGDSSLSPEAHVSGRSVLSLGGLALLTATKFADALTTGIGLTFIPGIYEANPLVDLVFQEIGLVWGLILNSFLIILVIMIITEVGSIVISVRRRDGHLAPFVRIVGYGIPSVVFAAIALYNVQVLLTGLRHTDWLIVVGP